MITTVLRAPRYFPQWCPAEARKTDGTGHRRVAGAGDRHRHQPDPHHPVVLMLTTPRARANGPAFLAGWLLGLGIVGAVVLALAGPAGASQSGKPASWVSWVQIALGVLLLLVALRQFRGRPRDGEDAQMPKWMGAIDKFKPLTELGFAAVLAGANPKNLLLAVAGAAAIAQTGISGAQQAIAYLVFALIATTGVAAPVVIYFAMGERSQGMLTKLKDWMSRNNAVIMSVLCLVIAAKLIGDAISGLTG
jgi:threonine/homoserine/homoserine lactone efflux protein